MSTDQTQTCRILVCSSCRRTGEGKEVPFPQRSGGLLAKAIKAVVGQENLPIKVQTCRCFGVCDLGKQVGVSIDMPGKDTLILADLTPYDARIVLDFAKAQIDTHKRVRTKRMLGPEYTQYYLLRVPARLS